MADLGSLLDKHFETTAGERTVGEMLEGDRPTVFISYPKDFTLVCTKQLCSYRDDWASLSALPCNWWGINREPIDTHRKFKSAKTFPFDLISDPTGRLLDALGLKGLLWTRRGFAVVSPEGRVLDSSAIVPFKYRKPEEVKEYLEPILSS